LKRFSNFPLHKKKDFEKRFGGGSLERERESRGDLEGVGDTIQKCANAGEDLPVGWGIERVVSKQLFLRKWVAHKKTKRERETESTGRDRGKQLGSAQSQARKFARVKAS